MRSWKYARTYLVLVCALVCNSCTKKTSVNEECRKEIEAKDLNTWYSNSIEIVNSEYRKKLEYVLENKIEQLDIYILNDGVADGATFDEIPENSIFVAPYEHYTTYQKRIALKDEDVKLVGKLIAETLRSSGTGSVFSHKPT